MSPLPTGRHKRFRSGRLQVIADRLFGSPPIQLGANRRSRARFLVRGVRKSHKLVAEFSLAARPATRAIPSSYVE